LKRILAWGAIGGALILVLRVIEYQHFVRTLPGEVYGGLIAVIFCSVGMYVGLRWSRPSEPVPAEPRPAPPAAPSAPFTADERKLRELGITAREQEVLALIAQGLSNREIGERLFVSENTVKTHASRLFEKIGVSRRVQAVQRGRELGLVP
jgi:two-component system, NarL family, response regulator LiaR